MKEYYEPEAQERGQQHGEQEEGDEYRTKDSGQKERAYKDEAHDDAEYNDAARGDKQANEAQEVMLEDKAHREVQDGGAYQDTVQEYQARKRRVMSGENEDGAALRAQQLQEGRKPVEKGKYQRLNRFRSSNDDTNEKDRMSVDDTEEGSSTRRRPQISRQQPRRDLQGRKRAGATSAEIYEHFNGDYFWLYL